MVETESRLEQTADALAHRRWYALALLCTTFFVIILDGSIVIVAIPSIGSDLVMAQGASQWVISGYAVPFGGLLFLGGRAADRLGRRRTGGDVILRHLVARDAPVELAEAVIRLARDADVLGRGYDAAGADGLGGRRPGSVRT